MGSFAESALALWSPSLALSIYGWQAKNLENSIETRRVPLAGVAVAWPMLMSHLGLRERSRTQVWKSYQPALGTWRSSEPTFQTFPMSTSWKD